MWNKPWGLREGFLIGGGLIVIGELLQFTIGSVRWDYFSYPTNVVTLAIYMLLTIGLHALRNKVYFVEWMNQYSAAVPSIICTLALTLLMGITKQVPSHQPVVDPFGFSQMLSCWSFVLAYLWLVTQLGVTIIRRASEFTRRDIPFILNHLGLYIVLICATLGNADVERLTMHTVLNKAEWRASDPLGKIHELSMAIELQQFTIDEYPPKLIIIDNNTGKALPTEKSEHLSIEKEKTNNKLLDWNIKVDSLIPFAASVQISDNIKFVEWPTTGATYAAYVTATNTKSNLHREGWVSCGSFIFPYQALRLDSLSSLVMPDCEPRRFASTVKIYTKSGKTVNEVIEVNKPVKVDGWNIYQLSYDETKGRWSDTSIFELVRDPWLPYVYTGIFMMIIGALWMFTATPKQKKQIE